ncbi:hypothetical protein APHCRT_0287 [Anaplasma phagocytophilum str. CRT53-1]|uniref:Uncharacterized protein n=1 Tax=Anaplasma phagocytophilum str. CRT53-1 TaxID=1359157 RepID=A0A0F3Q8W1_ANAPH|nr:hypothetical protein APHCRT_0287 [Anaplasma phagocytophilum str. CRT53-1]
MSSFFSFILEIKKRYVPSERDKESVCHSTSEKKLVYFSEIYILINCHNI